MGSVPPRLGCHGLQEQTQVSLGLWVARMFRWLSRQSRESLPHLAVVEAGMMKAAVPLIVEFLVPPAWGRERESKDSVLRGGGQGGAQGSEVMHQWRFDPGVKC